MDRAEWMYKIPWAGNNMTFLQYVRMNLMCYCIVHDIYMCPNNYMLHACSVPINLKALSCVDTKLIRTSGLAKLTAEAGGSSKNL